MMTWSAIERAMNARNIMIDAAVGERIASGVEPERLVLCSHVSSVPPNAWLTVDGRPVWGLTWDHPGEYRWDLRLMTPAELDALPGGALRYAGDPTDIY